MDGAAAGWWCHECGGHNGPDHYRCHQCNVIKPYREVPESLQQPGPQPQPQLQQQPQPQPESMAAREERERQEAIQEFLDTCGPETEESQPMNIILLGGPGAGKSSLVNSVAAPLEGRYNEYDETGNYGDSKPMTIHARRFPKCCMAVKIQPLTPALQRCQEHYRPHNLPTLVDVAGLSDDDDQAMEMFLKLLSYGHIKEYDKITAVYKDCSSLMPEEVREKYRESFPNMRAHRIIFVASAVDTSPPTKLMACVAKIATAAYLEPGQKAVPLFGMLTKKDLVSDVSSEKFAEKQDAFRKSLGLSISRFYCGSCYHHDPSIPTGQLQADIDIPLLKFFTEVCNPRRQVICPDEDLPPVAPAPPPEEGADQVPAPAPRPAPNPRPWNPAGVVIDLLLSGIATVVFAVSCSFLPASRLQTHVQAACDDKVINNTKTTAHTDRLCSKKSDLVLDLMEQVPAAGLFFALMLLVLQIRRLLPW